jgi:hypothetical protein
MKRYDFSLVREACARPLSRFCSDHRRYRGRGRVARSLDRTRDERRRHALTDLASYRIYLGTSAPACPGTPFRTVARRRHAAAGQTVSTVVTGLTAGTTYFGRTAVDSAERMLGRRQRGGPR